jgi:hypothetical protein
MQYLVVYEISILVFPQGVDISLYWWEPDQEILPNHGFELLVYRPVCNQAFLFQTASQTHISFGIEICLVSIELLQSQKKKEVLHLKFCC